MLAAFSAPANASSVHQTGRRARGLIERARQSLARLVGCEAKDVTFTSGGSEANATVLTPHWQIGRDDVLVEHLLLGATEHPSVLSGGRFAQDRIGIIPVDSNGCIREDALADALEKVSGPTILSIMAANNETGAVQDLSAVRRIIRQSGKDVIFHVDAVQALGKCDLDDLTLSADVISVSAHKAGGPVGVGAIVRLRSDILFAPLVKGGGQELGRRAGTENTAAIAGFGAACESLCDNPSERSELARLRDSCEEGMKSTTPDLVIFSGLADRLPNTICCALPGVKAETAMIALDLEGICISSGSACSSGKVGQSHVLAAMGVEAELAQGALRISLGWQTSEEDIERFLAAWRSVSTRLLKKSEKAA